VVSRESSTAITVRPNKCPKVSGYEQAAHDVRDSPLPRNLTLDAWVVERVSL
jgi:hypothetical protein